MHDDFSRRRPYNAASDFIDANVARGLGKKVAFIDPDRSLTYEELRSRSIRFANSLRALGLKQEDRVALLLHDTVDFPVAFWGALRAGVIAIPLNTYLNVAHYNYILADSRASILVVATPLAQSFWSITEGLPCLKTLILVGESEVGKASLPGRDVHKFEDLLANANDEPTIANTLSDEVAFWLYTSGSTGDPKGVRHVHSSLMATARLFGQGILGIREDDVVHSASKLFFSYGLGNAITFPLSVGATAALWPHRPSPEGVFEIMRRHRPTIFYGVPSLYTALLAHREISRGAGSDRLRICVSAGEALPAHIGQRWRETVGVDVLDGLGSTEMLQTFLSNRPGDVRYGSTGKPVAGYEVRIVDETGRELGPDEIGELIVRGPSAGEGYWHQRAKSRRTFVGEWTHTGDKYRRDKDGYYYYCGRTDDMFKVSGMWVSPFDVEAALVSHEAVLEAAVIGKEDADGLVKPKAFIVLKDGFVADDALVETLKSLVKQKAGSWKFPRWIETREALPRTASGKIQRFVLRDEDLRAEGR
ncbi:MAG TPA: benzoate-CoA ligase family protein [Pseudolabrys sp.]|nr:benzoate-CoA ligase family protein [Pseudolabrys sp.]